MIDSRIKINAIYPIFVKELAFFPRPTDAGVQKIDGTMLDSYEMIVTTFSMIDNINQARFFERTFLVVNISPAIVFEIPFLTLSSANIDF